MGRHPIGIGAMTAAERQRRRRRRIAESERKTALEKRRSRVKTTDTSVPADIVHWRLFSVQTPLGERKFYMPLRCPLAACAGDLTDADVLVLLKQVTDLARKRGL